MELMKDEFREHLIGLSKVLFDSRSLSQMIHRKSHKTSGELIEVAANLFEEIEKRSFDYEIGKVPNAEESRYIDSYQTALDYFIRTMTKKINSTHNSNDLNGLLDRLG